MKKDEIQPLPGELSLAGNREIFLQTLLQIKKDLGISDEEFSSWMNCTEGKDILILLNQFYSIEIQKKSTALQQIFYRLDIPEKKIKQSKDLTAAEQVKFIALMTLERAFQKVYLRKFFADKGDKKK